MYKDCMPNGPVRWAIIAVIALIAMGVLCTPPFAQNDLREPCTALCESISLGSVWDSQIYLSYNECGIGIIITF